jgi:hypothetical protein
VTVGSEVGASLRSRLRDVLFVVMLLRLPGVLFVMRSDGFSAACLRGYPKQGNEIVTEVRVEEIL